MQINLKPLFKLSKRAYYADFLITPPLTIALMVLSLLHGFSLLWVIELGVGLFAWTLYEYIIHRWLLHGVWLFRDVHDLHHDNQKDYIALHPLATISIYAAIWLVFGVSYSPFAVGFSTGYVIYSALHTMFHYANFTSKLKRRHALHHKFDDTNYGVITSFWDMIFGTEFDIKTYRRPQAVKCRE